MHTCSTYLSTGSSYEKNIVVPHAFKMPGQIIEKGKEKLGCSRRQ